MYNKFEDLPLVNTGCDSYSTVYPEFKKFAKKSTTGELLEKMLELTPNNMWMQNNGNDVHLVITGGEPLLGWQRAYEELLSHPGMADIRNITFETNGTQKLQADFKKYLKEKFSPGREVTFSVSAKLSCSGESRDEAIKPEVLNQYQDIGHTYLKFVVATEDDIEEAIETLDIYRENGFTGHCYLMPVGGVESVYALNNRTVAMAAMKNGLRYSDRLQVPLFKNEWGT
jgi:organic radical activating enzyme